MSRKYIISKDKPNSFISEQYQKVRTNIDFSNLNEKIKVINLTSTFPGEGKTITAINLAVVYSQLKLKTLIIDMDLRKPKIHRAFGLLNKKGLCDCVANELSLTEAIDHVDKYLDVLVAGEKVPFPVEVLSANKTKALMKELKSEYDRIIIDCPPMTAVTDATIISNYSDGTIFVVASRKTNSSLAKNCIKELQNSDVTIIGGIINKVQKRDQAYGMKYYNYYD